MSGELRIYVRGSEPFCEKKPFNNYEQGYPGTHYVDLSLETFMPAPPFKGWSLLDEISRNPRVCGASICLVKWGYGYKGADFCSTDGRITVISKGDLSYAWGKDPRDVARMYLHLMKIEVKPLPAECERYGAHQPLPEKEMYPHEFAVMLILGMIPAGIMLAAGQRVLAAITWVAVVLVGCSLIHYLNGNGFRPFLHPVPTSTIWTKVQHGCTRYKKFLTEYFSS